MPTGLKRYQQSKHFHFITFSCYKRQPFLHTVAAKDTIQQILEQTRSSFNHYATGEPGPIEIESDWTFRRRERAALCESD